MKKITFGLLFLLSSYFSFSQTYYSNYLDMTSEWRTYISGWNGFSGGFTNHITTYFDGFETINGYMYYKQYVKNQYNSVDFVGNPVSQLTLTSYYYVREDPNGKFYILDPNNSNGESVLFDNQQILNAQIGDPFPGSSSTCNIQAIETIFLGSTPLKKINGTNLSTQRGSLEGVGEIGLACGTGVEGNTTLMCYTKQGITVQFGTIDCNSFPIPVRVNLAINTNALSENNLKVYPNPTSNSFKINVSSDFLNQKYQLYNIRGILILEGSLKEEEQEIDIEKYSNGIYILKVVGKDATQIRKIVKE
jgi:hypothetical protein